ncbi:hypothetical protein C461_13346 [Halorubrum aidingense JCM 13560]|uniref:Uncharacterized protein n=1 Tax=Halorubrum aidingense JCM 13560 TaxID=1230454 RepID=M0P782_9EURY|nr:hypothetical protein C461_13346 [Halorubrum aidingense JCM 13560]
MDDIETIGDRTEDSPDTERPIRRFHAQHPPDGSIGPAGEPSPPILIVRRREPVVVFRTLRENGPALLVPAAWIVAGGAVLDVVSTRALFVAHVVMSLLLVAFVAASWRDMTAGVLRAWKLVILAGTPVTLAGVVGFAAPGGIAGISADVFLAVALYGWALLPAPAFVYTGVRDAVAPRAYYFAAACSVVGAVVAALDGAPVAVAAGLFVVGVGQTAGILAATALY